MKNSSTFDATAVPPPQLSLEELFLYFFQCIDSASEQPSPSFCNELFLRWEHIMGTIKYRQASRIIIERLFHGGSVEVIGCSISRLAAETTRKLAPDIFLEVFGNMTPYIDLEQLIAIETQLQHLFCRKTISPEILLAGPVTKALAIDFFQFSFAIHMRWSQHFTEQCYRLQWVIPPQSRSAAMWYVGKKEFLQRLNWLCPFILPLLQSFWMRNHGGVLSGSILPLCILKHEIYTDAKEEFISHYREIYKTCAIDIFFANILPCNIQKIVHEFIEMLCLISMSSWKVHAEMRWDEDDSCFARKRRGVTFTIRQDRDQLEFPDFQLIFVRSNSIIETISQNHLPCVRASFDGNSLFVTATCFASWMSRFIEDSLLFGSTISAQRRSKTVFKYAMRGFGFGLRAVDNIRLPNTLVNWLNTNKGSSNVPLPPWHPLYNPIIWHKFMSADRVTELFECAE